MVNKVFLNILCMSRSNACMLRLSFCCSFAYKDEWGSITLVGVTFQNANDLKGRVFCLQITISLCKRLVYVWKVQWTCENVWAECENQFAFLQASNVACLCLRCVTAKCVVCVSLSNKICTTRRVRRAQAFIIALCATVLSRVRHVSHKVLRRTCIRRAKRKSRRFKTKILRRSAFNKINMSLLFSKQKNLCFALPPSTPFLCPSPPIWKVPLLTSFLLL